MAKPFKIPAWRKRQIDDKFKRKSRVVNSAVKEMEAVMSKAVDYILEHAKTGEFKAPSLNEMFAVSEGFYRDVVTQSYHASEAERRAQGGKRRLASINNPKIPKLKALESLFRDRRFWPSLMKRSAKLTERLRKAYLQKLRRKFKDLLPQILANDVTPENAKKRMMGAWEASKSRVETIFRTETTKYFGETQTAYFKDDPAIIGFMFDSIRDGSRTKICSSRHGLIYRPGTSGKSGLAYNTPALHWNCRSHLIALANTAYNRKMLEDPARDPENKAVAPLPPGWKK